VQAEGPDSAAALQPRVAALDVHPSGPMWGAGVLPSGLDVRELEQTTAAQFPALCAALVSAGVVQERRALRVALREVSGAVESAADGSISLRLRFTLRSGAFATTVLRELGEFGGQEIADA
jgi:tRNA pseudouridine13 synthase